MIKSTFKTIQNKISNKVAKSLDARCDVKETSVIWYDYLILLAPNTVLIRFQAGSTRVPQRTFSVFR